MQAQLERITSADGTPIAVARTGHGPPLVLVHGTSGDRLAWRLVAPFLEPHAELWALDRRGRGESGDAEAHALEREAEDVAAVVRSIGGPAWLFGHSYGARCALEAALSLPELAGLIVYEPPVATASDRAELPGLEALAAAGEHEELLTTFFLRVAGLSAAEVEQMRATPLWPGRVAAAPTIPRELRAVIEQPLDAPRFAALRMPVRLLVGSESPQAYRDVAEEIRAVAADAAIEVLDGQGHVATVTAPERLAGALLAFMR